VRVRERQIAFKDRHMLFKISTCGIHVEIININHAHAHTIPCNHTRTHAYARTSLHIHTHEEKHTTIFKQT